MVTHVNSLKLSEPDDKYQFSKNYFLFVFPVLDSSKDFPDTVKTSKKYQPVLVKRSQNNGSQIFDIIPYKNYTSVENYTTVALIL